MDKHIGSELVNRPRSRIPASDFREGAKGKLKGTGLRQSLARRRPNRGRKRGESVKGEGKENLRPCGRQESVFHWR